jgi:FKBP-type peptidyl-prolyl cis-trans isomerase FklB
MELFMNKISAFAATVSFVCCLIVPSLTLAADLKTEEQKVSYAIGLNIASNLKQMKEQGGFAVDANLVAQGLKDAMSGGKLKLSQEEVQATMQAFSQKMQAKQKEQMAARENEMKKAGEQNDIAGKAYLAANAKKEGVKKTKSGLQYKVLTKGKGPKPKATDTVTVNYRGTLIDGKEFDSSYSRGEPATFAVNAVIPGWTEVLQLMPEGSKWEVVIPSDLAYGPGGAGGDIGPNSTLVFEVELLKASNDSGDK